VDIQFSYDEARKAVVESVAPLGDDYKEVIRAGLFERRWVDKFENANKRSGAYSSGCHDTQPFVLMNYQENLDGIKTLAHELGHSAHSALSRSTQPIQYSDYSIFIAGTLSLLLFCPDAGLLPAVCLSSAACPLHKPLVVVDVSLAYSLMFSDGAPVFDGWGRATNTWAPPSSPHGVLFLTLPSRPHATPNRGGIHL